MSAAIAGLWALLLAAPPPAGPLAVFWSGGRTYLVDADAGALRFAPGWYASDGQRVHQYRMQVEARRTPGADGKTSRWTTWQRHTLGERSWRALTAPPESGEGFQDERAVVQFRGEAVVLARYRRHGTDAQIEASTLALPDGTPIEAPAGATEAVRWLAGRLPSAVDDCLTRPAGLLALDLPGGRRADWLALTDARAHCAGRAVALRLGPASSVVALPGGEWRDDTWHLAGGGHLRDVVDLRPGPNGVYALLLRGAALSDPGPRVLDFSALDDPCADREVQLWRAGQPLAPKSLGHVARLDGARWLAADDPLRAAMATRFLPVDAPCFAPLSLAGEPALDGHACRVEEEGRAWAGLDDLAAGAAGRLEGATLRIEIRVHDPERAPGDGVQFFAGSGRRPRSFRVDADGLHLSRRARGVSARFQPERDGYAVAATIDRGWLGNPPSLSLRVDDQDRDAGQVHLWVAGSAIDARNPRATPLPIGGRP